MTELFNRSELKERRRELRRNATPAERLLWDYLRGSKLADTKFRRQASIGAFIVDFYAPSLHLAIELDGSAHKSSDSPTLDRVRQRLIEEYASPFCDFGMKNWKQRRRLFWMPSGIRYRN